MSESFLTLREHELGQDVTKNHPLKLSSTADEKTYAIILKTLQPGTEQILLIVDGYSSDPDCHALLHSQYGFVCFEALKSNLAVQSYMQAFSGSISNGHMPLRQSSAEHRVLFQLHPRESLFIGSKTITVIPCQDTHLQIVSPGPETHEAAMDHPHEGETTQSVPETPGVVQANHRSPLENSNHEFDDDFKPTATAAAESLISQSSQLLNENTAKSDFFQPRTEDVTSLDNEMPNLDEFIETVATSLKRKAEDCDDHLMDPQDNKRSRESNEGPEAGHSGSQPERVESSSGNTVFANVLTFSFESSNASRIQQGSLGARDGLDLEAEYTRPENRSPALDKYSRNQETAHAEEQKVEEQLAQTSTNAASEETQDSMMSSIAVHRTDGVATKAERDERESGEEETALVIDTPKKVDDEVQSSAASSLQQPSSSTRSTRSTIKKTKRKADQANKGLRVLFASSTPIDSSKQFMRFLESKGVRGVSSVDECTHLCVNKSEGLKKTGKFVMAVLLGRQVLWFDWVTESIKARTILNPEHFAARSPDTETEWGVNLNEAIERGRKHEPGPFSGWNIVFTPAARYKAGKSGYSELARITSLAGSKTCSTVLPKSVPDIEDLTLIIAIRDDPALKMLKGKWRCFSQDIIALSAMRGLLDTSSDEFLIKDNPPSGL